MSSTRRQTDDPGALQRQPRTTRPVVARPGLQMTLDLLPSLGLQPEDIGLPAGSPPDELPWGEFARALDRMGPLDDTERIQEAMVQSFKSPALRRMQAVVRWSPNPMAVARVLSKVGGAQAFPAVDASVRELSGGAFQLWLHIPKPLPTSANFFHLCMVGNSANFQAVDPGARIDMVQVDPRTAYYEVRPSQLSLPIRLRRWVDSFRGRGAALDMLEEKQQQLQAQLAQTDRARKEAQQARRAAEDALRIRNAFLRRISHELRTPAHQTLALIELAKTEPDSQERTLLLETAHSSGWSLMQLLEGLLDLTALESEALQLRPEPIPLAPLLESLGAELLGPLSLQGRLIQVEVDDDLQVHADPKRLSQVLHALLDNTLTHGEGTVSLTASRTGDRPERIQLDIDDAGPGPSAIPPLGLFEVGDDRSTRKVDGLGLGLTLTPRLVTAMQGEFTLLGSPAGGTRARVTLPAAPEA